MLKPSQWLMLRYFFAPVLLFLVACRTRIRLANCSTMMRWSIEVGHGAKGTLLSGCVNEIELMSSKKSNQNHAAAADVADDNDNNDKDNHSMIDISDITTTPAELEAMLLSLSKSNNSNANHNNIIKTTSGIPRIFHQSYISTQVHAFIYPFVQSWHQGLSPSLSSSSLNHPGARRASSHPSTNQQQRSDWMFVWWTDDDIRWLVHTHYPTYAKVWEELPHTIMKADTARYFILHRYGGLYADIDIEYIHNNNNNNPITGSSTNTTAATATTMSIEDWLQQHARNPITQHPYQAYIFHDCADNSMMASIPNSTFWPLVFQEWTSKASNPFFQTVNRISGIDMLKDICDMHPPYLATPTRQQTNLFAYHHGTNTWRWKTKRDDIVRICDVIILVHLFICVIILALNHYFHIDALRWIYVVVFNSSSCCHPNGAASNNTRRNYGNANEYDNNNNDVNYNNDKELIRLR